MKKAYVAILIMLCLSNTALARRVRFFGYVLDEDNRGIELANAYIEGTTVGTTTNRNGYYDLQADIADSVTLVYSMVGYETIRQRFLTERDVLQINVVLPASAEALSEVEVRAVQRQTGQMDKIDVSQTRLMPDASGGSIESILITFAGVTQNNELSSQYNARGGNFDENEVYVNGIEVYRPLLIRAGQQEGLSFVNADMVQDVSFSAGGFDAMYGDKMSSVLDITYKKPTQFEATLSASILGASAYVGTGDSTYSMMHGIRYKTSKYMLGALPTKGNYQPNFVDYQTYITWKLDKKRMHEGLSSRWQMSFMGNFSQNSYRFKPETASESFGGLSATRKLTIGFEGQEKDLFRTAFAALGAKGKVNNEVETGFNLSGFYTNEQENYDITNDYFMTDDPETDLTDAGGQTPAEANVKDQALSGDSIKGNVLGKGMFHEHSRNRLSAGVVTLAHNGIWTRNQNKMQWGISAQAELISDNIQEWQWRDSMGYSMPTSADDMNLYYSLRGSKQMRSARLQAYLQDTYKWSTKAGNILLTAGVRAQWWSYNKEFLCSPRASLTFLPGWKRDFSFRLATGLYYQAPFYKELRRMVTGADGITRISLNPDIKAQRSVHVILGADYYFRAWGRPFRLTAEAYYKYIDRVVNYTVENVRIRYSGENDGIAYTTGIDLKLYGELVPGAESWISLSAMRSRQDLANDDQGWITGMNEQRFAFSMLFQDYIPRLPQLKVHLKTIVSDGLPFALPNNPSIRGHMKTYFRLDIGASWEFTQKAYAWMRKSKHVKRWALQFEVFNLTDYKNVNSYFWVTDAHNTLWACPNYLTGRMFNGKITIDLY
ncbi:MAG: TonB-dependent receptor [Paludibacteraceae bacterium]|nr:TonB-dependent receptor [Paludibacteraceae bacterium]